MNNKYPSETFCILPWTHLFVRNTGHMQPCNCSREFPTRYSIADGIENYWNSEEMTSLREALLNGEKPEICNYCWNKEQTGDKFSKRLTELSRMGKHTNYTTTNITSMDLRLGNKCNLKCIMCGPTSSSTWAAETGTITTDDWFENTKTWADVNQHIGNLQKLRLAGGEPFIITKHFDILENLIATGCSKNISIGYHTNATVLPDRMINLWANFKRVDISCSIDGVGKLNEYIRYPSKWSNIVNTLTKLDNTEDNIKIGINTTINALNVKYIPELYDFLVSQNYRKIIKEGDSGITRFILNLVTFPEKLSIQILPEHEKQLITKKLQTHLENNTLPDYYQMQLTYIINYLNKKSTYTTHYNDFLKYIASIENTRGNHYPYPLYRPGES